MKILDKTKLEELLVAKWTQFIDSSKLMKFIADNAVIQRHNFKNVSDVVKIKGNQILISRFDLTNQGFIIWVEFQIKMEDQIAMGTTEVLINSAGILTHIQTIGNIYLTK